ncbi:hypothetical protein ACHHYP_12494 [Achlya hypogyna]|uniref:Uncharacterized protein n=1 Tax=Achlya hypogyna TaxID=1202772 RepID=A0A1V9YGU3_ACHHY|nr:hypothetical protein ACHHYP_12494 [Achlya hypogyna]
MATRLNAASLAELVVGRPASFVAYVHQVQLETLKDKPHATLWVGDPAIAFFKLHAWAGDAAPVAARIAAGDIASFRDVYVKYYRGNKEGHLHASGVAVAVRHNQFRDHDSAESPSFTSVLPLLDWSKTLQSSGRSFGHVDVPVVKIKDLRENMLAHVVCRLRRAGPLDSADAVLYDGPEAGMALNVCHKTPAFLSLRYGAIVRLTHIVVSFNSLRQSLVANTTGESRVEYLDGVSEPVAPARMQPLEFDGFAEAEEAELNGHAIFRQVGIRHLILPFDWDDGPHGIYRLVEKYCVHCECALPEQPLDVQPRLYGRCTNLCGGKPRDAWRYRPLVLELVDVHGVSVHVHAQDVAIAALVGNIPAAQVVLPTDGLEHRVVVEALLRSLADCKHPLDIHVYCSVLGTGPHPAVFTLMGIP